MSPNENEYITLATHMQTLHNTTESQRDNQHRYKQLLSVTFFSKVYVNILDLVCWFATRCAGKNTSIFCTQFSPENHRCIAYTGVIVSPKLLDDKISIISDRLRKEILLREVQLLFIKESVIIQTLLLP